MLKKIQIISLLAASLLFGACSHMQTTDPYTGEQKTSNLGVGAGIGAAVGALAGAVSHPNRAKESALIGAAAGGLLGGSVGHYMDQQEAQLRKELSDTGVRVVRSGDNIQLVMPGNITFRTGSADINSKFYPVLDAVAKVINKYKGTTVNIAGHTDNTGSYQRNMSLSLERSESVATYSRTRGIDVKRLFTTGYGASRPIASNATNDGRTQNRRVEITLRPVQA